MKSQTFRSRCSASGVGKRLYVALLLAVLGAPSCTPAGQAEENTERPAAPAPPQEQQRDVRSLTEEAPVKQWQEGEPVRIVPDLRENGETRTGEGPPPPQPLKPTVRKPVAPQVMERNVNDLADTKPYEEGDPVRIAPDLKESNPTD
jgi:hypothetical protein